MNHLPDRFRQLLALRELQGLSYRELAEVMCIPMGTVMSGLSRSRQAFRLALDSEMNAYRSLLALSPQAAIINASPLAATNPHVTRNRMTDPLGSKI